MKNLLKLLFVVVTVLTGLMSKAANVESWEIVSPLPGSGQTVSINGDAVTQIKFNVTCRRNDSETSGSFPLRLKANSTDGSSKAMHPDVYIKINDFYYGGKIHNVVTKTFIVAVDLSDTYYPNQTTIRLAVSAGVTSSYSNTYPVIVPIVNNTICCSAEYSTPTAPATTLTGTTPIGGNGVYTYQWKYAVEPDTLASGFINVPTNGTSATYTTPALTQNTYYIRVVNSNSTPSVPEVRSYRVKILVNTSGQRIGNDIDDLNTQSGISTYPNPMSNEFTIDANGLEIKNIEIVNANGTNVYTQNTVFDKQVVVDASYWSKGVFFVRIVTADNEVITKKIVKTE